MLRWGGRREPLLGGWQSRVRQTSAILASPTGTVAPANASGLLRAVLARGKVRVYKALVGTNNLLEIHLPALRGEPVPIPLEPL